MTVPKSFWLHHFSLGIATLCLTGVVAPTVYLTVHESVVLPVQAQQPVKEPLTPLISSQCASTSRKADLEAAQALLVEERAAGDLTKVGETLHKIGEIYENSGQFRQALAAYEQALTLRRKVGDRKGEGRTLNNIGRVYSQQSRYSDALRVLQQALQLRRSLPDRAGEGGTLINLGRVYHYQGQYPQALQFYQAALSIMREVNNRRGEATVLDNIALVSTELGQFAQAVDFHQQAFIVAKSISNQALESQILHNTGFAYERLKQYAKAAEFYQQALKIRQQAKDCFGEGRTLNNLGFVQAQLGQFTESRQNLEKALEIVQELGDRIFEGKVLDSLATTYKNQGLYSKAIQLYQQALIAKQAAADRSTEWITLSSLAEIFQKQNKPELAIVFYKQAVNITESIRKDLRVLPREQQESYTQSVAETYRRLADLLLAQGRLAEAQRVLELLKLQELKDFTRSRPVEEKQEIALLQLEKQILEQYGSLVNFGQKLYECESKGNPCKDLRDKLDQLTVSFNRESNTFTKTLRERLAKDPAFLTSDQLGNTATNIVTVEAGTVLIYPLVLDDKLRLLLATRAGKGGVVFRTVEVSNAGQQQVWRTVSRFRDLLQSPSSDLKELQQVSAQLYDWLIRPLESELNQGQVRHLVFALDRATRYIPMTALFDRQSNQYLVQKYAVSTILAAELTNTQDRLPTDANQISILALGVSKPTDGFSALPNVLEELNAIVRDSRLQFQGIYQGSGFLDDEFDYTTFRDNLSDRQIVHIATHGKFEPGRPENSFILLGKGKRLTIEEIQKLSNYIGNIHLVVLSACQTAVGGPDESGIEIPGVSFYFLRNRVKTVIASLWQVNDSSTSLLMQKFYQNLATGKMTKVEALRQAQRSLLTNSRQDNETNTRSSVVYNPRQSQPANISRDFSHPYYWAPFVLIGNGL
jgi:CHAT domain-containing protein/tetratricopeptide (TPR) repeat protein